MSVEPGFTLVDEGLGAAVDPAAPGDVRAYLPARDAAAVRRATGEVDRALGHLQAFGLRQIGEIQTKVVHESDWASAWKRHVRVLRIGRRIVIRPTWRRHRRRPGDVVIAMDPGMAFGTGLHPTTRLCLAGIERWADEGLIGRGRRRRRERPPARRRLRVGDPGESPRDCWVPATWSASTPTRSRSRRRSRTPAATASRGGSASGEGTLPSGAGPFDLVTANLIASLLVALAPDLAGELRPGRAAPRVGHLRRPRGGRAGGVRARRPARSSGATSEGDWVALEAALTE